MKITIDEKMCAKHKMTLSECLLALAFRSNRSFLFDCRFPVKPGMTVVDGVRDHLFGDGNGYDRSGFRQQGLSGCDGEGNGIPGRGRG